MYWPIGTPRIFATSSSRSSSAQLVKSQDGVHIPPLLADIGQDREADGAAGSGSSPGPGADLLSPHNDIQTPITPMTPRTPAVESVEHDDYDDEATETASPSDQQVADSLEVPTKDPVLALRVSRTGHLYAVITKTSITIWQTKVSLQYPTWVCGQADVFQFI